MIHRPPVLGAAVRLDDLARDRRHDARRHELEEHVVGLLELDLQRVAVERLQALELRVVVEPAARLRGRDELVGADELAVEVEAPERAHPRVDQPLPAVDVVRGDELARLALEHRVRREVDAGLDPDDDRRAAVADFRQRPRGRRPQRVRALQVVVLEQRVEDPAADPAGVAVVRDLRVEPVDVLLERDAKRLDGLRRRAPRAGPRR